jgi:hypothetical protein
MVISGTPFFLFSFLESMVLDCTRATHAACLLDWRMDYPFRVFHTFISLHILQELSFFDLAPESLFFLG